MRFPTGLSRAAMFGCLFAPLVAHAALDEPLPVDRLIVKFKSAPGATRSNGNDAAMARLRGRSDVSLTPLRQTRNGALVLRMGASRHYRDALKLASTLSSDAAVEYVEPDLRMQASATASDPLFSQQWHYVEPLASVNLAGAWNVTHGEGVVVAVLDTGIRPHADLASNILPGYDFVSDAFMGNDGDGRDANPADPGDWMEIGDCGSGVPSAFQASSWHGTHVAGTIAAVANNGVGGTGVAPGAKVLPVRVLGKCGGYLSDIADAIVWASGGTVAGVPANPTPANIINMSLGSTVAAACTQTYSSAIATARANGTFVVVAAGNSNGNAASYPPANCPGVFAVAAVGRDGSRAYYSNTGSVVSAAAPGGAQSFANDPNGILSTVDTGIRGPTGDGYVFMQGTSMATPHVAGVAALVLSAAPGQTPDQLASALKASARPFPATCNGCGSGLVDAAQAVGYVKGAWAPGATANLKLELIGNNGRFIADPNDSTKGTISYIAKLTNQGPSVPASVVLTSEFPADVRLISASGMACNSAATQCSAGSLAVGSSTSVTFTFATSNKGKMTFKGWATSEMQDVDPADNTVQTLFGGHLGALLLAAPLLWLRRRALGKRQA